ncbi:MAG TPA: thioredoxin domain-containing protein, partial [Candidatus Latescibacteria bacterium]|nr:thioredoxin domain-containing protein [Candidatus Latescibacterota bacterium]
PLLLEARSKRVWPGRDDKVQVSWNGLMISAMTVGYQVSGDRKYLDAAGRAASFILAQMVQPDGRLLHSYKDGSVSNNAYLDDYGGLINALIDLYESTFDETWLERATQLADTTISQFWDDEGDSFFYTGIDHEALIVRSKNPYDNATPSGNSLTALAFIRLGTLLRRDDYTSIAERTIRRFQPYMLETPNGFAQMICAADYVLGGPVEVIVTEGEGKEEMIRAIND